MILVFNFAPSRRGVPICCYLYGNSPIRGSDKRRVAYGLPFCSLCIAENANRRISILTKVCSFIFDFCLLVAHKFPMITTDVTSKALIWSFHNSFFR
ncbi:hypothetical protein SLEP1_g18611 [Rubroshorea leprosula]|uniref:Uncharacterized protein n=1 Tax=Rubroshorea leprosula TaxID=152421 RepID=A0AAV5J758_9ROSI|nr:hypothetical protein SLEP1_g18611 [Rubroshorea leprosula]